MWQAERLRGSPVRLFRNDARSRDEEEAGEEEEDMIYQLMANEFYAGRTCTLTPSRVVKRSTMGRELEPQLRHPAEELPVSLSCSSDEPRSPYEEIGALRQRTIAQLPSRSDLLDMSPFGSDDDDDDVPPLPPQPLHPAATSDAGVALRRWQPTPSLDEVNAAAEGLLLAEALRFRHDACLRRGLQALCTWIERPWREQLQRAVGRWRHRALGEAWSAWGDASTRAAHAAGDRRELRRARLSDALLGWRDVRRRRAQERMLLLVDAFRRMWVFLHTQRLASRLLEVDTSP
jgi:hypothetical protein